MANGKYIEQLAQYIGEQVRKGYSVNAIRNFLINRGYNKEQVEEAIMLLYGKKKLKIDMRQILIFSLIGFVIAGIIFFIVLMMGNGDDMQEEIVYEGIQRETGLNQERAVPIEETAEEVETPVEVIQEPIEIEEEEPSLEPEQYQSQYSPAQIDNLIKNTNEREGERFCNDVDGRLRDHCFNRLAIFHNKSSYCDRIDRVGTRDGCYMTFAFTSNFEICAKIQNQYQKLTCRELGRAKKYDQYELLARVVNGTLND